MESWKKTVVLSMQRTLADVVAWPDGTSILVACSGGIDSMVLLHSLLSLASHKHRTWHIGVATVNHGIRPEGAAELQMVAQWCSEQGIPFYGTAIDVLQLAKQHKMSEETMGRQMRYEFLQHTARTQGYQCIAVAHHKNDQAETVLAHLLRGSGLQGLCGMRVVSKDHGPVPIVRPLLGVYKQDLYDYGKQAGLPYAEDVSNGDITYQRNAIRHTVIPPMQVINDRAVDHICQLASTVQDDANYLHDAMLAVYERALLADNPVVLQRKVLQRTHPALLHRLWPFLIQKGVSSEHIRQLSHMIAGGEAKYMKVAGITIRCEKDRVYIDSGKEKTNTV